MILLPVALAPVLRRGVVALPAVRADPVVHPFTLRVYVSDPRDDAAVAASVLALAADAGFGG